MRLLQTNHIKVCSYLGKVSIVVWCVLFLQNGLNLLGNSSKVYHLRSKNILGCNKITNLFSDFENNPCQLLILVLICDLITTKNSANDHKSILKAAHDTPTEYMAPCHSYQTLFFNHKTQKDETYDDIITDQSPWILLPNMLMFLILMYDIDTFTVILVIYIKCYI